MELIAIAGNARSGKDSLCESLRILYEIRKKKVTRIAFADDLKEEVDEFLKSSLGISAFTQDNDEKNIIRPFLVWWGTEFRRSLDEDHWVKLAEKKLDRDGINIITDLRYPNEAAWVKKNGGSIIYLERFTSSGVIAPANSYEREFNPQLKKMADTCLKWGELSDKKDRLDYVLKEYKLL